MSEEIKKEAQYAELSTEELDKVTGGEFVLVQGDKNEITGQQKKCRLCGQTFYSFGSVYCGACEYIMEHGISK